MTTPDISELHICSESDPEHPSEDQILSDDEDVKATRRSHEAREAQLAAIEKQYGLTEIPDSNVDVLPADDELTGDIPVDTTWIELIHLKIHSLEDLHLEKFANLESLNLRCNLITSIHGLKDIPNKDSMEELDFYDNRIKHISKYMNEFSHLQNLDLSFNNIRHMRNLDKLTKLENLYLVQNKITKIDGIANLTSLTNLELGGNRIEQIEGLDTLVNLRQLWLGQNRIKRLQGLSKLQQLRVLSIQSNSIDADSLGELQECQALEEVYLADNNLCHIDAMPYLPNLTTLDVSGNKLESLPQHLEKLFPLLTDLWMSRNSLGPTVNALSPALSGLSRLECIYLESNPCAQDPLYRRKVQLILPKIEKIDALYTKSGV